MPRVRASEADAVATVVALCAAVAGLVHARGPGRRRMASASAMTCRCRFPSICSARPPPSSCLSSSSGSLPVILPVPAAIRASISRRILADGSPIRFFWRCSSSSRAGVFILTVTAGFCGNQDPYRNIAPTLVWIIWWVGLAIFSAFVGDLWAVVNPWRSLFDWRRPAYRDADRPHRPALRLPYPEALGVWPAVGLLLAVSWTELVFPSPAVPANIAWLALAYSLLTWGGMAVFGSETWIKHGEVFAVFFGLFARFAPTEASIRQAVGHRRIGICGRSGRGCWQTLPHPPRWSPSSCSCCRAFSTTAC